MTNNKILDGLCYISIVFAPFLFPFIVWLLTKQGSETHFHAGRAFKLHLIPVILSLFCIFFLGLFAIGVSSNLFAIFLVILTVIVDVALGVYNIYYGIKMFLS